MPGRPGDPRNTTAWQRTRAAILTRDNRTCRHCGSTRRPSVHHITPTNNQHDPLFHDHTNLITLCPTCHHRADLNTGAAGTGGRKASRRPQGKGGSNLHEGDQQAGGPVASLPAGNSSRVW